MACSRSRSAAPGFTLVELMIVVAILGVLVSIALPHLVSSRLSANESAAVQTLRAIAAAQATFQSRGLVDNDLRPDGVAEYGYFAEMAGTKPVRGGVAPVRPAVIAASLGIVQLGAVRAAGYEFAIFLPDQNGLGVPEDPGGGKADPAELDSNLAEQLWACYAWPLRRGYTGNRAYLMNQMGEIVVSDNRAAAQQYEADTVRPNFDAAYSAPDMRSPLAQGDPALAQDGGLWVPLR